MSTSCARAYAVSAQCPSSVTLPRTSIRSAAMKMVSEQDSDGLPDGPRASAAAPLRAACAHVARCKEAPDQWAGASPRRKADRAERGRAAIGESSRYCHHIGVRCWKPVRFKPPHSASQGILVALVPPLVMPEHDEQRDQVGEEG